MVQLQISSSKEGGRKFTVDVNAEEATIADVKAAIYAKNKKLYPARQRLTLAVDSSKRLTDETKLRDSFGGQLEDGLELTLKDLGPQIDWRTVFFFEYLGPLIIHPLFYHFPKFWYGREFKHSALQKYVYTFVMIHFVKRELETLFIHRFSHATMPAFNILKNSFHYHVLSGLFLALDVYRFKYSATSPYITNTIRDNERFLWIFAGIWAFFELSNLHTHLNMRSLRPAGSTKRAIPHGYGFSLVSCPNYFFELMGWVTVSFITSSIAAWFFAVVSAVQMIIWALKKHKTYKKEFGKQYPPQRKAVIPFLL